MTRKRADKAIPANELLAIAYRLAVRHGNRGADRDDAAQDFCVGALERRAAGAKPPNPKGHEYAAGHRHQRSGERRRRRVKAATVRLNGHDTATERDLVVGLEAAETRAAVERALSLLRPKERAVLALRFGLHDGTERTLKQVASIVHRSPERIRQIEQGAFRRLRRYLCP